MSETLVVEDLVVHRPGLDQPVLHQVNLTVAPGKVTILLGRNGSGKTTLVKTLAGAIDPSSGSITLGDADLTRLRPERRRPAGLVAIPEGHMVLGALTVLDNLRAAGSHLHRSALAERIDQALELFPELAQRRGQTARVLSGGERQMVTIAQGVIAHPVIMVIDELSLGLAPIVVTRLVQAVRDLVAQGIGVLLIEQYTDVALGLASDAYVMSQGKIVYQGDAAHLAGRRDLLASLYLAQ